MTVAAGSIQSFQKGKWQKRRTVPVISTEVEKSHSPMVCGRQAACHHGAVIKKGCEEMMTIFSQPFFKKEYQMRIMLPAAKRRQ